MNARSYDARADLDQLSPSWSVHVTDLHGDDELFIWARRKVLIDPARHGENWMRAHVAAHLALRHHDQAQCGVFTDQQERDADALARGRIDLAQAHGIELFELPPIDGDPSIPRSSMT